MSVVDHPCVSSAPLARRIRSVRWGPARGLCVGCVGLLLSLHAVAQRTDAPVSPQESDTGLLQHWPSGQAREAVLASARDKSVRRGLAPHPADPER